MADSVKDNKELDKLDKPTMRKSMRSPEELLAEFATDGEPQLTVDEERLIDRITFSQKGERFGRFKEEQVVEELSMPLLTKDTSMGATRREATVVRPNKADLPSVPPIERTVYDLDSTQSVS